jgi:acetyl-CoA carboxylase carboxyl transferase subunit alpha
MRIRQNPLDFEQELVKLASEIEQLEKDPGSSSKKLQSLKERLDTQFQKTLRNLAPYQRVLLARHVDRPTAKVLLSQIVDDFIELHGDRVFGEDSALICGLAKIGGLRVAICAQEKGKDINEKIKYNFGMLHPEGYRKALRIFRLAEKFKLPIVNIIDTPGAYPGDKAEERGQASAIALNLLDLAQLTVPTISVILGEGGSGGALALALTDKIFMFENAYYSVISPEGCASILFPNNAASHVAECAQMLKLSAQDLQKFGIIDGIIKERYAGLHWGWEESFEELKEMIVQSFHQFQNKTVENMLKERFEKYSRMGVFYE